MNDSPFSEADLEKNTYEMLAQFLHRRKARLRNAFAAVDPSIFFFPLVIIFFSHFQKTRKKGKSFSVGVEIGHGKGDRIS